MRIVYLLATCVSTVLAAPLPADQTKDPSSNNPSSDTKSNGGGESRGGIIAAGVVFAVVVVVVIVAVAIMYFRDPQNFLKRRRKQRMSQLSTVPLEEDDFMKRSSVVSDRESIMFSRSRSSSMQFAVVESEQPQPMQKAFYRQGDDYVPLDQVDTSYNAGSDAMNRERPYDPHVSSYDGNSNASAIPVVITPPPDTSNDPKTDSHREKLLPPNPPVERDISDHHLTSVTTASSAHFTTSPTTRSYDESSALLTSSR